MAVGKVALMLDHLPLVDWSAALDGANPFVLHTTEFSSPFEHLRAKQLLNMAFLCKWKMVWVADAQDVWVEKQRPVPEWSGI